MKMEKSGKRQKSGENSPDKMPTDSRRTIFLVENDDDIRHLYELFLKGKYDVVSCANGKKAIRDIKHGLEFDLAMIDLSLPDIGGDVVIAEIKETNPNAQILIASNYPFIQKGINFRHIGKPTEQDALLKIIEEYF